MKNIKLLLTIFAVGMVTLFTACPESEPTSEPQKFEEISTPAIDDSTGGNPADLRDRFTGGRSTPITPPPISSTSIMLTESGFNDGSFPAISTVTLSSGKLKDDTSENNPYTALTLSNLPEGLTLVVKRTSNNSIALSFDGNATSHGMANNVSGTTLNLKTLVEVAEVPEPTVTIGFIFRDDFADPIFIHTPQELQKINEYPKRNYTLADDIDMEDVDWTPIGRGKDVNDVNDKTIDWTMAYSGTFDGAGHTISNLQIGSSILDAGKYTGLFGKTNDATIKNLLISHSGIWGSDYVGALVGYAKKTTLTAVGMQSTVNGTTVYGSKNMVGGLVGEVEDSTVSGYATGNVSGKSNVGGLVGWALDGTVNGYATGNVSGNGYVGGLVGWVRGGTVNGYATGNVSGQYTIGGLVGLSTRGTVNGYARGVVERTKGSGKSFGLLMGTGPGTGYHSKSDSRFKESIKFATGTDGIEVDISTVNNHKQTFRDFTFGGTKVGEWAWKTGKWPAINLHTFPDGKGKFATDQQPIDP